MNKYKCELCGQTFKTSTGSTTKRHLDSKKHRDALKVKVLPSYEHELLLYITIKRLKSPSYSNILKSFSSFGIKTENTLKTIIKKLKDKDIVYKGINDFDYEKMLQIFLDLQNINYPMTFTIQEALKKFQKLNYKYAPDLIQFFNKLSQKYPELLAFSSSKIGELPDLITFRQIFINQLDFYPNNNWDL